MANRGRSTDGRAREPYQPRAEHIEAAKHLRLTVTRYISERASLNDIHEAVAILVSVAPVSGESGYRSPCKFCRIRASRGLEGQCPDCSAQRTRREMEAEREATRRRGRAAEDGV